MMSRSIKKGKYISWVWQTENEGVPFGEDGRVFSSSVGYSVYWLIFPLLFDSIEDLIQILPTQITWVNFLSRLNLLVCWVLGTIILILAQIGNVPAGYVKIITSTNLPRLQTSVKFPTFVEYFLYFARCDYQTWSNYELLGALSSIVHKFLLSRENPKLEKTVQRSIAFDRAGHPIYIFNTDTSYGSESVCFLCNKRQVWLHWNWRLETKKQLAINSTLCKVMYERTTEFIDLWMIINVKDCRRQR